MGKRSWKIGDRYGKLTIIDEGKSKGSHTYVKVQCDCKSPPFEVRLEHLKGQSHSRTISCGCMSKSSGELKICQILKRKNIKFNSQYRIKNSNNEIMIFDFVILNDNNQIIKCIEFDGIQHFHAIKYFGGEKSFIQQQKRDKRKDDWCKENKIPLIRIPYYDFNKIESYLDF